MRRQARRLPAPAAQGWRARGGRDDAGLDLAGLARRSRSGSAGLHPGPGQRGPDRVRADAGAGRRVRDPAARRRGVQGAVPGGQRPVHRRPGRRPPVGDLLRARPATAGHPRRPRRPGGRDRPGPAVRRLPRGDVRAHPPLRRQRADRRARAAAAARQLRRRRRRRPRATARPSPSRPGSSSPTPNGKSPSPRISTSRTPKPSRCSRRWPGHGPGHRGEAVTGRHRGARGRHRAA